MIYSEAAFAFVMEQANFSLYLKSWAYAYKYVLTDPFLCGKFKAESLHFTDFDLHPGERLYWNPAPLNLPELADHKRYVAFWSGVEHWCAMVILNRHYRLIHNVSGTGGGVGIAAAYSCSSEVLQQELMGLLQDCTKEQTLALRNVYHFGSLYQSRSNAKKDLVQILFGPASLLNNDNASPFTFMDKKYLSNRTVTWRVPKQRVVGPTLWEVTCLHTMCGVMLWHDCDFEVFYAQGEQVFVNYRDDNFVDLTHDSSDEDNVFNCPTTPHKRPRRLFECQQDGVDSNVVSSGGSSSSSRSASASSNSSSFTFGTSSSQTSSGSSDSSYTASV